MASRSALSACLVAALVAGCGGKHADPQKRTDCLLDAENAAAMPVVSQLYAAGKLGTPAAFKHRFFPDVPPMAYLDASGRLKPFASLKGKARGDAEKMIFGHLMVSPSPYVDQLQAAYNRGRRHASC